MSARPPPAGDWRVLRVIRVGASASKRGEVCGAFALVEEGLPKEAAANLANHLTLQTGRLHLPWRMPERAGPPKPVSRAERAVARRKALDWLREHQRERRGVPLRADCCDEIGHELTAAEFVELVLQEAAERQ